jgi:hypothetical protein
MLPFGPEPFALSPAVKKCEGQNLQDYNFACGSAWVWNMISDSKKRT